MFVSFFAQLRRCIKLGDLEMKANLENQEACRRQHFIDRSLSDLQARIRIEASAYRVCLYILIQFMYLVVSNCIDPIR